MAKKTVGLTGSDNIISYDDLSDPVDIAIVVDGDLDDAVNKTIKDQIDNYVESPLSEALEEAERMKWDNGDGSMTVDIDTDFSGVAPDATFLDMDADDIIKTTRDMIAFPMSDDEIIDIVNDFE